MLTFNYQSSFVRYFLSSSQVLFNNNLLIFLIALISLIIIINTCKKNLQNILLIILIIMSNVQLSIYHKYYDPLLDLFFTLFRFNLKNIDLKSYLIFFCYNFSFLLISIIY